MALNVWIRSQTLKVFWEICSAVRLLIPPLLERFTSLLKLMQIAQHQVRGHHRLKTFILIPQKCQQST